MGYYLHADTGQISSGRHAGRHPQPAAEALRLGIGMAITVIQHFTLVPGTLTVAENLSYVAREGAGKVVNWKKECEDQSQRVHEDDAVSSSRITPPR